MKKVWVITKINTWADPPTWDVFKAFSSKEGAYSFYYKDWPANADRYRIEELRVEK